MVQFPGEFPDLLPFFSHDSFSLRWVLPGDTLRRKGASGNYHVSAIRLFKHLTVVYGRHPWSRPWKTSHRAGKIEQCWQKIRVECASRTSQRPPGDPRPRLFLTPVSLAGRVPLRAQLRSRVTLGGELGEPGAPPPRGLATTSQWVWGWTPRRGQFSGFWGGQGTPVGRRCPEDPWGR